MAMNRFKRGMDFLCSLVEQTIADEASKAQAQNETDMVYLDKSIVNALLAKQNDLAGDEQIIFAYHRANGELKLALDTALEECGKAKALAVSFGAISAGLAVLLLASVAGWLQ